MKYKVGDRVKVRDDLENTGISSVGFSVNYCMKKLTGDVAHRMEAVAELFGLKLGEKFEIEGANYNPHQFTEEGLFDCDGEISPDSLGRLFHGALKIKKPLNPKIEEQLKELAKEMDRLSEKLKALENGDISNA